MNRLSIRGGTFFHHGDAVEVVIVNAAKVSRAYFANEFDGENTVAPTCWSEDTQRPDPFVDERQANRCLDCKQNIRGSAGQGRACRFQQRLAVVFEDNLEEVYQLMLPATSIFGKTINGHMPLQEYAKHLSKHNTKAVSVVTKIYFDKHSVVPKLFFKPIQGLNKEQLETVSGMIDHPDTHEAITSLVKEQSATSSPFDSVKGYVH
tara:strand:+ start:2401 stop:3018 length:618 start_codon:yes stop_codon:yes gene_type:complete